MQLAIDLPDELGRQVLQHPNVQEFVQTAIEKMLLEEQSGIQDDVPPQTRSLIGLMKKSPADEADYKQHLKEKYL